MLVMATAILNTYAQTPRIEAARKQFLTSSTDAAKLKAALGLCDEWESYPLDTFHFYLQRATQLAAELRDIDAQNAALYFTGAFYFQKNRFNRRWSDKAYSCGCTAYR